MKTFWSKHVRAPFLRALIEVPWFGPVISAVLVAALINLTTEGLLTLGGWGVAAGIMGGLVLLTVAFVYAYGWAEQRRRQQGLKTIRDLPHPPQHRGLVFLYSREETLREAISYHLPRLEHCWLLVTPEVRGQVHEFPRRFPAVQFTIHAVADKYDTGDCYRIVRDVFLHEAARLGWEPTEIIADITGGTKPMTMGMILACVEGGYAVEHVPTEYGADLRPKEPLPPIQIVVELGP